jgi:hypothetical protein
MDYSYRLYGQGSVVIDAVGEIQPNEAALFAAFERSLPRSVKGKHLALVVFDSPGGSVSGAIDLAKLIETVFRTNTGVAEGGECASACVLAWAVGAQKSAASNSRIGVHNASVGGTAAADQRTADVAANYSDAIMAKYLAAYGAPANVVGHLMMTSSNNMYWLTPNDLTAWNVKITYPNGTDPNEEEWLDPPETKHPVETELEKLW